MKKRQSFIGGATILVFSTIIVKIIGALYKIPLTNLIGGVGMGYYMSAYGLFNPIYSMSVAGFPIAVSKLISSGRSKDRNFNSVAVLRNAFFLFATIGTVMWACLYLLSTPFSILVQNPLAQPAIKAIAPAILFAATGAAFRGYFEGHYNMFPTGVSQGIEAVSKLVFGTILAMMAMSAISSGDTFWLKFGIVEGDYDSSLPIVAAAGIFGVTLGSVMSLMFLCVYSLFSRESAGDIKKKSKTSISKQLIAFAVPVSLAAFMTNITTTIDLVSIMNGLTFAVDNGAEVIRNSYDIVITSDISNSELPTFLYGSYTGLAVTIFNILPAISVAISTTSLPIISSLWASSNKQKLRQVAASILKLTGLIAIPAGIGITVLSEEILTLFFINNPLEIVVASELLRTLGIAVIFVGFVSPISSILQGIGSVYLPAKLMVIGGVVKLTTNFIFVQVPSINIKIAPLSTLLCYSIITLLGLIVIDRKLDLNLNLVSIFLKPVIGAIFCAATAKYLCNTLIGSRFTIILAVFAGVIVYLIFIILSEAITGDDLRFLSSESKFISWLEKKNIIK